MGGLKTILGETVPMLLERPTATKDVATLTRQLDASLGLNCRLMKQVGRMGQVIDRLAYFACDDPRDVPPLVRAAAKGADGSMDKPCISTCIGNAKAKQPSTPPPAHLLGAAKKRSAGKANPPSTPPQLHLLGAAKKRSAGEAEKPSTPPPGEPKQPSTRPPAHLLNVEKISAVDLAPATRSKAGGPLAATSGAPSLLGYEPAQPPPKKLRPSAPSEPKAHFGGA